MTTGRIPSVDGGIQPTIIDAAGDLIYGASNDTPARLAIGTAGQVLAVNSGATAPEWVTATSGGMTLLASGTLSGAQVDLTSISGTYKNLQLVIREFTPSTDGQYVYVRFNADSGSNYRIVDSNTAEAASVSFTTLARISNTQDNTVSDSLIIFDIYDYANTATWKFGNATAMTNNETDPTQFGHKRTTLFYKSTSAISEINLFPNAGTFSAGSYLLYGVK